MFQLIFAFNTIWVYIQCKNLQHAQKNALVSTQFRMVLTQIVTQVYKDSLSLISLHYLCYIVLQIAGWAVPTLSYGLCPSLVVVMGLGRLSQVFLVVGKLKVSWALSSLWGLVICYLPLLQLGEVFMVCSVAKGLNQMPRGLKVSRLLIVNIILLSTQVTLKVEIVYIRTLVQHIGILEMIVLRFGMQGEDIVEHTINQQVSCLRFSVQEEVILKHTNVTCHLCILQSTCRPLCSKVIHLVALLNIPMPRYQ